MDEEDLGVDSKSGVTPSRKTSKKWADVLVEKMDQPRNQRDMVHENGMGTRRRFQPPSLSTSRITLARERNKWKSAWACTPVRTGHRSIHTVMASSSPENPSNFAKPSRKGDRFANPPSFSSWIGIPGFINLLKWRLLEKDNSNISTNISELDEKIPVHNLTKFESALDSRMFAAWLGHATVLVQMEGVRFITDPVWSKRASFSQWLGPMRYRPSPMQIVNLPSLHFGVISHDHYDHLDCDAVAEINERNPSMRWFVPLGVKEWMRTIGVYNSDKAPDKVVEMEWGENVQIRAEDKDVTVWCVPSQHWGQRGAFDRNKRLWCGWTVMTPNRRFYYTGDTGFCENEFKKIGKNLGPFDLAAIPIGAYCPRWIMKSQHIDPNEAVKVHEYVKSKFSIGIHWGTYHMGSYEYYLEPKMRLKDIMEKRKDLPPFVTVEAGKIWGKNTHLARTECHGNVMLLHGDVLQKKLWKQFQ